MKPKPTITRPVGDARGRERAPSGPGRLESLATLLTAAVVVSRWLTPTEGAVAGETLWIVQFAFLALLAWTLSACRSASVPVRLDWIDAAVALMAAGQFVAAACNRAQSDGRALVNMVWEWCGLLVTWLLLRRLAGRPDWRAGLTSTFLALTAAQAGLGIWQHYVAIPETRREVLKLQQEWDELESAGRPADRRDALDYERRLQQLRLQLVQQGIPVEGSSRTLWDQRLQSSSEPYGLFGLANTFAGLLVAGLMLWMGLWATAYREREGRGTTIALLAICLTLAYCLVLTKSRTAYVGLLCGAAVAAISSGMARASTRSAWRWACGLVVAISLLGMLAAATGGLDTLVLSESFKSLRYRGEYWLGTWRMLTADPAHWLIGVGPGNFRPHYLEFKLPQSSEEIADPHNLILDMWAGGGLLSLAGAALLLAAGVRLVWQRSPDVAPTDEAQPEGASRMAAAAADRMAPRQWLNPVVIGAALAFGLAYLAGGMSDLRLVVLGFGWIGMLAVVPAGASERLSLVWFGAAFVSLAVHLLGAGGISMPAITQTLLWPAALGAVVVPPRARLASDWPRWTGFAAVAAGFALYVGCWMTATIPVMQARNELARGEQALYEEGRIDLGDRAFRQAAVSDPLAAEACERLAELHLLRWLSTRDERDFDKSVDWQLRAIARQPRHIQGYRRLGAAYLSRFDRTQDPADAERAADELARAVALYPAHAELLSELAEAYWRAGQVDVARQFADQAAELDAINHEAGHVDKYLSEGRLEVLDAIHQASGGRQPPVSSESGEPKAESRGTKDE